MDDKTTNHANATKATKYQRATPMFQKILFYCTTSEGGPFNSDILHDFKRKKLDVLKAPLGHRASCNSI